MYTKPIESCPYDIESTISYLARDELWMKEKPYIADFPVPEGAALSNQIIAKEPVTIYDLRGRSKALGDLKGTLRSNNCPTASLNPSEYHPTLSSNGFCVISMSSRLTATEALGNPRACEESYFGEITSAMKAQFPEYRRFECIDLTVRKRDSTFPWNGEVRLLKHEQPAAVAHADYSLTGALMELAAVFPGQEKYFEGKQFDVLKCIFSHHFEIISDSMFCFAHKHGVYGVLFKGRTMTGHWPSVMG
ncbi:hypothetical protein ONZ43_g6046 [Nemania bipapillata]|uniref:Uncharacterized protein n=1 Tax=Nemania bipapillata TaxID=110536 RepID=A0ACC2I3H5_9PEZI|nr:hypothetical protein ONZ43_g6046 [Nemania bipapillata]